uniref:DUF4140 domain-containing protein n=1 Tax=Ditylenchus dipsaci TaxID=166011 RepID=A0A915E0J1_9BILA
MSSDSTSSLASTQIFEARELHIKKVTVYTDRAELVRTFKVTLQQGLNEIVVENVSHSIESDSIRVDGSGAATIHEVQFKTDHVRQDEVDNPQVKELVDELEIVKEKSAQIDDIKQIYGNGSTL